VPDLHIKVQDAADRSTNLNNDGTRLGRGLISGA
jgi:hypothetical protein